MTMAVSNIVIELTINEARILCEAIGNYNPPQKDEMIAFMLYARIKKKIEEPPKEDA